MQFASHTIDDGRRDWYSHRPSTHQQPFSEKGRQVSAKHCSNCGQSKAFAEFKQLKTRLDSWCKACYAAKAKACRAKKLSTIKCCTNCGDDKPLDKFPPAKKMIDGRGSWCRDCVNAGAALWRAKQRSTAKVVVNGKECTKCGCFKHRSMFSPQQTHSTGLHSWCKKCQAVYANSRRSEPVAREQHNESVRQHRKTERHKETRKAYIDRPEYRLKDAARKMVMFAVKAGVMERPHVCELSGQLGVECRGRIEGHHHNGYDVRHWLDVVWCCKSHHVVLEMQEKESNGLV